MPDRSGGEAVGHIDSGGACDPPAQRRRAQVAVFAIGRSVVTAGLLAIMGTSTITLGMVLVLRYWYYHLGKGTV